MFDFWYDLPPILRAALGLGLMGIAVLIGFVSYHGMRGPTFIGYGLFVTGLVMLLCCTAGNTGGGYKF